MNQPLGASVCGSALLFLFDCILFIYLFYFILFNFFFFFLGGG